MKNRLIRIALLALCGPVLALAQVAQRAPVLVGPEREITLPQLEVQELLMLLASRGFPFEFDLRMTFKCNGTGLCSTVVRPSGLPSVPDPERRACRSRCDGLTGEARDQCLAPCPPER